MELLLLFMVLFIRLPISTVGHGDRTMDNVGHFVESDKPRSQSSHSDHHGLVAMDIRSSGHQEQIPDAVDMYTPYYGDTLHVDPVEVGNCIHNTLLATLTCSTIPVRIPRDVTTVTVTSQETNIHDGAFNDLSFANILHLSLNGVGLSEFTEYSFVGLDSLTNITISGMDTLYGASLQLAISSAGVLPKLKYFALNPGATFRSPFIEFKTAFVDKLVSYHLDCLNLSNIISLIKFYEFFKFALVSNLNVVNLTGSFLVIDYSYISGYTDVWQTPLNKPIVNVFDSSKLRTTNVTDSSGLYTRDDGPECFGTHPIYPEFLLVETWYANDIYPVQTDFLGYCDLSSYQMFLKQLQFTGNKIAKLNVTVVLPRNNTLLSLDLSNNGLEYLGPKLLASLSSLEDLVLSKNELYHMEHLLEFETLLTPLERLGLFDLSYNYISFIPSKMFVSNRRLNTLILRHNRLTSITFELGNLTELLLLDVRDNSIVIIDDNILIKLQFVFNERHQNFTILFKGNPIECTCKGLDFIIWLVSQKGASNESINCRYRSDYITVDKAAVSKCHYLCKRALIIAMSTTCSLVVVTSFVILYVMMKRRQMKKKKQDTEGQLREIVEAGNFMCFMAMSGNDEALVERVVLANLRRLLQGKLGVDRDLVCTGTDFKPGFPICKEAYRLVKKCQVFVAVVSDSFLRSRYCMLELQEACKQNKPTILIFLGHVETEDMPQYMQEVFRRTSRAWIKQNQAGYYYVVPNLIDMSEAIWDLAVADLLHKN